MIVGVQLNVVPETSRIFCRAPSLSKKPVDVGPEHGKGVVQRKERVKSNLF